MSYRIVKIPRGFLGQDHYFVVQAKGWLWGWNTVLHADGAAECFLTEKEAERAIEEWTAPTKKPEVTKIVQWPAQSASCGDDCHSKDKLKP